MSAAHWVAAAAVASVAFAAPAARASQGRKLALVIGVDEFIDPEWSRLRFARKDARDVAAALEPSFDEVMVLGANERATHNTVQRALARLRRANTSDRDTVLIYVSTHGTLARDHNGQLERLLVLHDTADDRPWSTGLSFAGLVGFLDGLRSRHQLLIVAACHAGVGKSAFGEELKRELRALKGAFFAEPSHRTGEGRIILTASGWGEPAREDDRLENDIYTHFFLEALQTSYDRNNDGATSALEIHDYARNKTIAYTDGQQRPTLSAEIHGLDPIVLRGRIERLGDPLVAAYGGRFVGAHLEVDGRYKGELPGSFVVEEGERHIRVLRPDSEQPLLDDRFAVARATPLVLDALDRASPAERSLSAGFGWRFFRAGEIARHYFPDFPFARASLAWPVAEELLLEIEVAASSVRQQVTVETAGGDVGATQRLTFAQPSVGLSWLPLRRARVTLSIAARAGWIVGTREVELELLAEPSQPVSMPFAGLRAALAFWPTSTVGVRMATGVDLAVVQVEEATEAVASDYHSVGVIVNL